MCVYCMMGDWQFKYDPPFRVDPITWPSVPQPPPEKKITDWDITRLKEYLAILKEVKELEDKLGCPCVPNKADYIKLLRERIDRIEQAGRIGQMG